MQFAPASNMSRPRIAEQFARRAAEWTGSTMAFLLAFLVIVAWAISGPIFGFSDTWQLVINTGTTIVTFLMVFLIQRAQNKDAQAVHLKLNELVASTRGASNRLINVEDMSESEIELLHQHFQQLVKLARSRGDLKESHSIEEAKKRHETKGRAKKTRTAAKR
jgi:low affinity Fe/Cu permease